MTHKDPQYDIMYNSMYNALSDAPISLTVDSLTVSAVDLTGTNAGAITDSAQTNPASASTFYGYFKGMLTGITNLAATISGGKILVTETNSASIKTGTDNLAAIKTNSDKIPSQGQALAAASLPVVLPATQITTLTPPAAITNYAAETGGNLAAIKANSDTIVSNTAHIIAVASELKTGTGSAQTITASGNYFKISNSPLATAALSYAIGSFTGYVLPGDSSPDSVFYGDFSSISVTASLGAQYTYFVGNSN